MSVLFIVAVSRSKSPSGVCRGAVSTANAVASLQNVDKIYLAVGQWQVGYFTQQFKLVSAKIEVIGIDIPNSSLGRNRWTLITLPRLIRQLGADHVLLSYPMPVWKILFPASCRLMVIIHDLYPFSNPANFGYPNVYANQLFMHICVANVDQFIFISQETRKTFEVYFKEQRQPGQVIHWYAALDPTEQERPALLPIGQRYLLTVAQHRKNKNVYLLLQTFSKLLTEHRIPANTHLYIVGINGPETNKLEQFVTKEELGHLVHFVQALTDPELAFMYAHCELVICPSSAEGFGYTIIESALFNKRVICSDIPIFREVGMEQCVYFTLDNDASNQLANVIEQVFKEQTPLHITNKDRQFEIMKSLYNTLLDRQYVRRKQVSSSL